MYLIKRIRVEQGRANVKVEDGIKLQNLAKTGEEPKLKLISDRWRCLSVYVSSEIFKNLKEESDGYKILDFANTVTRGYKKNCDNYYSTIKSQKREDNIEGYIITVEGMTPGTITKLTGMKIEGLYAEEAICLLKEGESFEFGNLLKIRVKNGKLIVE